MSEEEYKTVDPKKLPLLAIGIIFGYLLSSGIFMIPFLIGKPENTLPSDVERFLGMIMNAIFWVAVCIYISPKLGLEKFKTKKVSENIKYYFAGLGMLIVTLLVYNQFSLFLKETFGYEPELQEVAKTVQNLSENSLILAFLMTVTLAPIVEEILFRQILYKALKKNGTITQAAILSSFAFAIIHINPHVFAPLFVFALIFAWSYEKTGSLIVPILLHATNNLYSVVNLYLLSLSN